MQGKLIAVAYTLRLYWNQFSLGGFYKQKNASVMFVLYPRRLKSLNFDNFDNSHINFLWPEYFIDVLYLWKMDPISDLYNHLVFTLPPRDSTLQYKRCVHLWYKFPCIITLDRPVFGLNMGQLNSTIGFLPFSSF